MKQKALLLQNALLEEMVKGFSAYEQAISAPSVMEAGIRKQDCTITGQKMLGEGEKLAVVLVQKPEEQKDEE